MRSPLYNRDPVKLFLKRVGLLVLLVAVAFAASGVWGVYQKERESAVLRDQAVHEHEDLLAREARLKDDIEKLKTDRGMEEVLRSQYSLAESGEGLIIIVEPPAATTVAATSSPIGKWFENLFGWWK